MRLRRGARGAVAGIHKQLQHDVSSATGILRWLEAGSAAADRARKALLRDVSTNSGNITKVQQAVNTLTSDVNTLNTTVAKLTAGQQSLDRRVTALEQHTTATTTTTTTTSP